MPDLLAARSLLAMALRSHIAFAMTSVALLLMSVRAESRRHRTGDALDCAVRATVLSRTGTFHDFQRYGTDASKPFRRALGRNGCCTLLG